MRTRPSTPSNLLDELVPPLGPRWRPVALVGIVAAACAALALAWNAGLVTPMVTRPQIRSWGGGGPEPVHLSLEVEARGTDVELIDVWETPPGLAVRAVSVVPVEIDERIVMDDQATNTMSGVQLPAAIPGGEAVRITATYDVIDCDALAAENLSVEVRRQLGPFEIARTRALELRFEGHWTVEREIPPDQLGPGSSSPLYQNVPVSWAEAISEAVCQPKSIDLPS